MPPTLPDELLFWHLRNKQNKFKQKQLLQEIMAAVNYQGINKNEVMKKGIDPVTWTKTRLLFFMAN